jgi:hypothetical protein
MTTGEPPRERAQAAARSVRPFSIWTELTYRALLLTPLLFRERSTPAADDTGRLTSQRALELLRNPLVCGLIAVLIATSVTLLATGSGDALAELQHRIGE